MGMKEPAVHSEVLGGAEFIQASRRYWVLLCVAEGSMAALDALSCCSLW